MIWLLILILAFSVVLLGIYMICAYHSEKRKLRKIKSSSKKTAKLCSKCATGKKSYELDPHSESCPHITSYKNGKCSYFKSIK